MRSLTARYRKNIPKSDQNPMLFLFETWNNMSKFDKKYLLTQTALGTV